MPPVLPPDPRFPRTDLPIGRAAAFLTPEEHRLHDFLGPMRSAEDIALTLTDLPAVLHALARARFDARVAREQVAVLTADLAACFRLSGADPDGDEDWRLAEHAVAEVRVLRRETEADEIRTAAEIADLSGKVANLLAANEALRAEIAPLRLRIPFSEPVAIRRGPDLPGFPGQPNGGS